MKSHPRRLQPVPSSPAGASAAGGSADPAAGMLSAVMHDLRNSLSAIQVLTQLGERRSTDGEQLTCFRKIEEQVRVVFDLLRVLREVALPEPLVDASVPQLLREAAEEALSGGQQPAVRLDWRQEGECRLPLRVSLFRRAALALLRHSLAAMPQGGRLLVEAACRDDGTELVIADTGAAIHREAQEDFFRPFNRGLGGEEAQDLYLAWLVFTRLLRGELLLEPGPGGGTLFRIRLPRS